MAPLRTLLVDDAAEMRALVGMSLRLDGRFDVVGEAGNGREAVDLAAAYRPDLVLLDLSMPVMDGLEALPLIRAAVPETVVVVFSAFEEERLGAEAKARGAVAYVTKGVPLDCLANLLAEAHGAHAP